MIVLKNKHTLQLVVILGISLVTTLALIWGTAHYAQGLSPFTTAVHAAPLSAPTCATTKGTQKSLCEHQDPIVQGCVIDAETLNLQTVSQGNQQTKPLGEVELRYSPKCKTYWVRTTAFITAKGIFKTIHAMLLFHNHTKEDIVGTPPFADPHAAYIVWTDMTTAPIETHAGSGSFDIIGQPQPFMAPLRA